MQVIDVSSRKIVREYGAHSHTVNDAVRIYHAKGMCLFFEFLFTGFAIFFSLFFLFSFSSVHFFND